MAQLPPRVFITGATGFIGSRVALDVLEAGYRVRISVRKEEQCPFVEARYRGAAPIEFAVIPDITNGEDIQNALGDVDYILHIASPMPDKGEGDSFKQAYLGPALKGTEAVLNAALATPTIKTVVITSSALAMIPMGGLMTPGLVIKGKPSPVLL